MDGGDGGGEEEEADTSFVCLFVCLFVCGDKNEKEGRKKKKKKKKKKKNLIVFSGDLRRRLLWEAVSAASS